MYPPTQPPAVPTLHVAVDEAGDFRFDKHGSKYLILTAAYTYDPEPLASSLTALRFSLLKCGHDLPAFHCCDDKQVNRDAVVQRMVAATGWAFAAVVVPKNQAHPSIRPPETLYPMFAKTLIRFILRHRLRTGTSQVVVCMDRLLKGKHREALTKTIKQVCAAENSSLQPWIYAHPKESNKWIQVADYCCWAIMKKWERGDERTYSTLRPKLTAYELNVFRYGSGQTYY